MKKKKICMVVQDKMVRGGIAAVIRGYFGSELEDKYDIIYVESYKDGNKIQKLLKGIKGYFDFIRVLLFDSPDLIHIHSSFGPSFYRKLPFIYMAGLAKKPIVNHIHGADFDEFYTYANNKKKRQIQNAYNKCTVIIALSEQWKERLSMIVPEEKIVVIENYSILHSGALEDRKKRDLNYKVLFLGEIGKRKGCYDIPSVIARVSRKIGNVEFIIGGVGSQSDENAIRNLIKCEEVEENVEFPGWVRGEKKDKLLREADVFFLPSYNEGMPMSILDAMGYGLPVVSTNVGGIPLIVNSAKNGYCCNPGDIDAFANAICELLSSRESCIDRGRESFEIVRKKYSLEQHIIELEQVYERCIYGK